MARVPDFTDHRVPIYEIAARVGYGHDVAGFVESLPAMTGLNVAAQIAPNSTGQPSLPDDVATEVLTRVVEHIDQHNERWAAYQVYLRERAERAREERIALTRSLEQEDRAKVRKAYEKDQEARREDNAKRLAREQEELAKRRGAPVDFEKFKQGA